MDRILGYFFFGSSDVSSDRQNKKAESDFISCIVRLDNLLSDYIHSITADMSKWEDFDKKGFLDKMYELTLDLAKLTVKTHQYTTISKKLLPIVLLGAMYHDFDITLVNNIISNADDINQSHGCHYLMSIYKNYCSCRTYNFDTYLSILIETKNAVKIVHDMFFKDFEQSNSEFESRVCNVVPEIQKIIIPN